MLLPVVVSTRSKCKGNTFYKRSQMFVAPMGCFDCRECSDFCRLSESKVLFLPKSVCFDLYFFGEGVYFSLLFRVGDRGN